MNAPPIITDMDAYFADLMKAAEEDARYEAAERAHVWREEGGPLDDDYDMPDPDEPAEDLG